jgi:hypothetical protein
VSPARGSGERRAAARGHAPGHRGRRGHRHLLPDDGPDRQLERIERRRQPQARPPAHERLQCRIARQVRVDGRRVGAAVEHAPRPRHQRNGPAQLGQLQAQVQPVAAAGRDGQETRAAFGQRQRARV